jgi:hypothetical protein
MAARPQNIGIKAIEIYFPSQVRQLPLHPPQFSKIMPLTVISFNSMLSRPSSRSSMVLPLASTPLV